MGNLESNEQQSRKLTPPEKLTDKHNVLEFDSGVEVLDNWLKKRALANEKSGASRTYVVCVDNQVVGYYALAVGAVSHSDAIRNVRRNMPNPIPVMVLGRLAIHKNWQGFGLGSALLRDAVLRTLTAAEIAGIKAILVHAISEKAKAFYEKYGFKSSPIDSMTLMITIAEIELLITSS